MEPTLLLEARAEDAHLAALFSSLSSSSASTRASSPRSAGASRLAARRQRQRPVSGFVRCFRSSAIRLCGRRELALGSRLDCASARSCRARRRRRASTRRTALVAAVSARRREPGAAASARLARGGARRSASAAACAGATAACATEPDARDQVARPAIHRPAGADVIAHARKLVEARLQTLEAAIVGGDRSSPICITSVSSSWLRSPMARDARHARAALERVQQALELGHLLAVAAAIHVAARRARARRPRAARSPPR